MGSGHRYDGVSNDQGMLTLNLAARGYVACGAPVHTNLPFTTFIIKRMRINK